MRTAWACLLVGLLPGPASTLEPPFRMEAAGKPIDLFGGHAAPALADLDGDGVRDLLVGQFLGEGRIPLEATMRWWRNEGTEKAPKFGEGRWIDGGDARATVPTG